VLLLAICLPAFQSTGITGLVTAVRGFLAFHGTLVLSFEEGWSYSGINVSPGQELV
jgi:hypothetical protein